MKWQYGRIALFLVTLGTAFQPASAIDAEKVLLDATVRIRVTSGSTTGYASGTVIDQTSSHAVVATCAHAFTNAKQSQSIEVTSYANSPELHYTATLVGLHVDSDVALLRVDDLKVPKTIPLASEKSVTIGQHVYIAGCDFGGVPELWETQITAKNRFVGEPTVEVDAMPNDGRSGGGLVTEQLRLVGVCTGINPLVNDGLYAGASAFGNLRTRGTAEEQRVANPVPQVARRDVAAAAINTDLEVICIVRSRSNPDEDDVTVLKNVSASFLGALRAEQRRILDPGSSRTAIE